jgi:gliding motility-associated-like protein
MKKIFTIGLFLLLFFKGFSTHLAGAFIRYEVINDLTRTYKIFLEITRDCSGSTFLQPDVKVYCGTNCSTLLTTLTLPEDSVRVRSQVCNLNQTSCNGGPLPGLETHYYSITTTLSACASKLYTFTWTQGARNGGLLNIDNPGSQDFSVYTSHKFSYIPNANFSTNTAPILLAPPVPFFYAGSKVCYSVSAIDTVDNDILTYELVACSGTNTTGSCFNALPYAPASNPQYSFTQPFGTSIAHTFDPVTGVLSFTPPASAAGLYNFAVKIKEFRGGNLIGEYIRDLQCAIIPAPQGGGTNISCDPVATSPDPTVVIVTNSFATTCCGKFFTIDLTFPTVPGSSAGTGFQIDYANSSIPNWATVILDTVGGLKATITGTPPCPGGNLEKFVLKLKQVCVPGVQIPAVAIIIFKLSIREDFSAYPENEANPNEDTIICAGGFVKLRAIGAVNPDYRWTILKGDSSILPPIGYFQGPIWLINPKRTTRFKVTDNNALLGGPNNCKGFDIVNVFVIDSFTVQATTVPEDCRHIRYNSSVAIIAPNSFNFQNNKIRLAYNWFGAYNPAMSSKDTVEFNNSYSKTPRFSPIRGAQRCQEVVVIPKETKACEQKSIVCAWVRFSDFPKTFIGVKNLIEYCKGDTVRLKVEPVKTNSTRTCATVTNALPGTPVGNTTSIPINPYNFAASLTNKYKQIQFIIPKSELNAVGIIGNTKIDRISFNLSGVGAGNNLAIQFRSIKMGVTQKNDYTSSNSYLSGTRDLLNFDGRIITPVNGDNLILLDKAFFYDGSGNLVVELFVKTAGSAANYNPLIAIQKISAPNTCIQNVSNDSVASNVTSGTLQNERPAIKVGYCKNFEGLKYVWETPTNLGINNPNVFLPNNTTGNLNLVLNNLRNDVIRKDTQFVYLIMKEDSSDCKDTTILAFPKIKSGVYFSDPNNAASLAKTDSICTNTQITLKVDDFYSVPAQNRYSVDWFYQDLNSTSTIKPTNILASNTSSFKPVFAGTQPKKVYLYGKVFPRDTAKVRTNLVYCEVDSAALTVFPDAKLNFTTPDLTKCLNKTYPIVANATNFWQGVSKDIADFSLVQYVWDTLPGPLRITSATGVNNEKLNVSNKVTKIYNLSARGACIDSTVSKQITVTVPFIDSLNLNVTKSEFDYCVNKPIPLNGLITGKTGSVNPIAYTYKWWSRKQGTSFVNTSPTIGTDEDLTYTFTEPGTYTVRYSANDSCAYLPAFKDVDFEIKPCDIPNIFTPDADGKNDFFAINFALGQSAKLKIFDRWGKEVYKNDNYTCSYGNSGIDPSNNCFTGKDLNDGTYFYSFEIAGDKKYQGYVQIVNNK